MVSCKHKHSYFREQFSWMRKSTDMETIKMQKSLVREYKIKWYTSYEVVEVVEVVPEKEGN